MANKILIRLIGTLTCVAAVATAWDAEAARCHRHHRRCCYTAPCCAPVCDPCCAPVCATVCAPACDSCCAPACSTCRVNGSCCYTTVVRREVIVPSCCQASIATEGVVIAEQTKQSAVKLTAKTTAAAATR